LPNIGHRGARFRRLHAGLALTLFAAIGVLAAACNLLTTESEQKRSPNIHDQVNSIDLLPRFPQPGGPTVADRSRGPNAVVVNGSEDVAVEKSVTLESAAPSAAGEGYDLNFENAPVTTVAKVILSDILGSGYIIDPRVQGTVTLTSGRPVAKSEVLFVLESALRA
jgi:general secretion pathway protein D